MKKIALAAAAAMIALGASSASAATITGTSVALLAGPPGVDDAFQVFLNGTNQVVGFPITLAGEAACANPADPINGCSFSRDTFTPASPPAAQPGVIISPRASLANQIAVFYLPDGTTIDAIFALGCDVDRDPATGLCIGQPNFTIVTPDPAHPFNLGNTRRRRREHRFHRNRNRRPHRHCLRSHQLHHRERGQRKPALHGKTRLERRERRERRARTCDAVAVRRRPCRCRRDAPPQKARLSRTFGVDGNGGLVPPFSFVAVLGTVAPTIVFKGLR